MSTQLQSPQYAPVPNGLKASYSVDFSVDTVYDLYLLSTYQGSPVIPVSLYIDNLNSDQDITVTMGGMSQKVPAYSSGSLQINGASSVQFQCNSSSTAQAAIDVLDYAIVYGTSSPGRGISPSLNNYPVNAPSYSVLGSSKGAGYIGEMRTETGAVLRLVQDKLNDIFNVLDFGAKGDNTADDTQAFINTCKAIQAAGGGILIIPPLSYKITIPLNGTLIQFSAIHGFVMLASGATINDVQNYGASDSGVFMNFVSCNNLHIERPYIKSQTPNFNNMNGAVFFRLEQGCSTYHIEFNCNGGLVGVETTRKNTDPVSYKSNHGFIDIQCTNTHYPYAAQFSGDDTTAIIEATNCGRNFMIYGVRNQKIRVKSLNQQVTSLMQAYNGLGNEDIDIEIYDRGSTQCQSAAPIISLNFGDSTPAIYRNIKIKLDVQNNTTAPFGHTFTIGKYSDGNGTPDNVGRGHVIDGLEITGVSDQNGAGNCHITMTDGAFAGPDKVSNLKLETFRGYGANSPIYTPGANVAQNTVELKNVWCDSNIFLTALPANIKYHIAGCKAQNISASNNDIVSADFYDTTITDGSGQSLLNKTFLHCLLGANLRPLNILPSLAVAGGLVQSFKQVTGPLNTQTNLFKITPLSSDGALFRIKYYLIANGAQTDPSLRQEVYGTLSFTATMDGNGIWQIQQGARNEIGPFSIGATPAALTISLVNGDTTGAYIAMSATNYTGSNAVGEFALEMVSMWPNNFSVIPQ